RDLASLRVSEFREPDIIQKRQRPFIERLERRLGSPEVERVATLSLQSDANVLKRGQVRKYGRNLKRADKPQPRHVGRLEIGDVAPVELDSSTRRRNEFRQHVETSGLASAIRPDERVDRPAADTEGNIADRAKIAEALAEAFGDENIVHAHSRRSAERMHSPQ